MKRQIIDVIDPKLNNILYVIVDNFNEGLTEEDKEKIISKIEGFKLDDYYINLVNQHNIRTVQIEEFDALTDDFGILICDMLDDIAYFAKLEENFARVRTKK